MVSVKPPLRRPRWTERSCVPPFVESQTRSRRYLEPRTAKRGSTSREWEFAATEQPYMIGRWGRKTAERKSARVQASAQGAGRHTLFRN